MLSDPYSVKPFTKPVAGTVTVPGSKSITNRALIMGALCNGPVTLYNALFSRDTRIMTGALKSLGFTIRTDQKSHQIEVSGQGGSIPRDGVSLNVGNAGTAARFLTSFLATSKDGEYFLDGDPAMRTRPMSGLLNALNSWGCSFQYSGQKGAFPFTMRPVGLSGGPVTVDARSSSQILSALLIASPLAKRDVSMQLDGDTVSRPFVTLTLKMMQQFGINQAKEITPGKFEISAPFSYHRDEGTYLIESDATAASYFLALPLITGGKIAVSSLYCASLQGDLLFMEVLKQLGMDIKGSADSILAQISTLPPDNLTVDFTDISDTFLTLAAIAPALPVKSIQINGIGHTRQQETDRINAMATELLKLDQGIEEGEDFLIIRPDHKSLKKCALGGVTIDTYEDHRIAMSFAILGSLDVLKSGKPWLFINDPACCGKTFPHFFDVLESLHSSNY